MFANILSALSISADNFLVWITGKSPYGITVHHIDDVLIGNRYKYMIQNVRKYRGAGYDSDNYLVEVKLRVKIRLTRLEHDNSVELAINIHKLRDGDTRIVLRNRFNALAISENMDDSWEDIKRVVKKMGLQEVLLTSKDSKKMIPTICSEARRSRREPFNEFGVTKCVVDGGVELNSHHKVVGYAADLALLGQRESDLIRFAEVLEREEETVGLRIRRDKLQYLDKKRYKDVKVKGNSLQVRGTAYKGLEKFKYLGCTITATNKKRKRDKHPH
ncbi:unnamed protein product [Diatraea saccharalis]|uniref:Uncharacterized protein n=1 Tax=Diatraea saccharalis TaxID=40085 RepID=A0A9N9QU37_9NEOP|nr:unnamed protein product [Diatraea saccharalis]